MRITSAAFAPYPHECPWVGRLGRLDIGSKSATGRDRASGDHTKEISDVKGFVASFKDIKMYVGLGHGWHVGILYRKSPR